MIGNQKRKYMKEMKINLKDWDILRFDSTILRNAVYYTDTYMSNFTHFKLWVAVVGDKFNSIS